MIRMTANRIPLLIATLFVGLTAVLNSPVPARGNTLRSCSSSPLNYTDRLIVKYKDSTAGRPAKTLSTQNMKSLSTSAGVTLTHFRRMSGDAHVLKMPGRMTVSEAQAIVQKISTQSNVLYAEPDKRMFPLAVPTDPYYTYQWNLFPYGAPDYVLGGINMPGAWDITTGAESIVIGLIDTGLRPHADIDTNILDSSGRVLPGYDFISLDTWKGSSYSYTANDGDGRDSDPSDPGDWITAAEDAGTDSTGGFYEGCGSGDSSWHGTHVAGIVAATANNGLGGAGINWNSKILPVRVLGKCGGYTSDIVDGMRWAAGLTVDGVTTNPNPAKVLNLSLGGSGTCSTTFQTAITEIIAAGVPIVVAAGNSGSDSYNASSPANCRGVICVAAVTRTGARAYYSNYGRHVKISAPGGQQSTTGDSNGIYSTLNSGTTTPGSDSYYYYAGTSMAAPHVTGVISLMLSLSPSLTPTEVLSIIQSTAHTFPTGTGRDCTTSTCGAGIIDAAAAVASLVPSGLTVSVSASPSPATIGNQMSHTTTVSNTGSSAVSSTVLTTTLTGTYSLVSTTPSQGTCSGTNPITCSFGSISGGSSATLTLVLLPTATGTISSVSAVTTSSSGTAITNNNATLSTSVENPVPVITSLNPSSTTAGGTSFTLTVSGSNFVNGSTVQWNGSSRETTYVSSTQLTATILADDIASSGTAAVSVVNATPGGGTASASFTISKVESSSTSSGSSGGGGGCFITTSSSGSYAHPFAVFGYLFVNPGFVPALVLTVLSLAGLCFASRRGSSKGM